MEQLPSTDIFDRFDDFIKKAATGPDHDVHDSLIYLEGDLWVVGGCILLHENNREKSERYLTKLLELDATEEL